MDKMLEKITGLVEAVSAITPLGVAALSIIAVILALALALKIIKNHSTAH